MYNRTELAAAGPAGRLMGRLLMNPVLPESFAHLLQYYRKAAGLTQEALAEQANLSARAISDLERGVKRRPRRETLQLLITALTLTPADAGRLAAAAHAAA